MRVLILAVLVAAALAEEPNAGNYLVDGVPVEGQVNTAEYGDYFFLARDRTTMHITVTPLEGDPDLYVACGQSYPDVPALWKSYYFGADEVIIDAQDPNFCADGRFAISVYGFGNTTFTILVQSEGSDRPTVLEPGLPLDGEVPVDGYEYYEFSGHGENVYLNIEMYTGDADLYVMCIDLPTESNYTWSSAAWGNDSIFIQWDDPNYCTEGPFMITVYGYSEAEYSIVGVPGQSSILLQPSVPRRDSVAKDEYEFFRFLTQYSEHAMVSIVITPLSIGDADVYVGCGPMMPTNTTYIWMAEDNGVDTININWDDANFCPEQFMLSVYGEQPAQYSLVVTTAASIPIILSTEVPQHGSVVAGGYQYFQYRHANDDNDVKFTITPEDSTVASLYVSCAPTKPTVKTHLWESAHVAAGAEATVTIAHDDTQYCDRAFYLAVYSRVESMHFNIEATIPGQVTEEME